LEFAVILAEEGYSAVAAAPGQTLLLDLTKTTQELRTGMRQHWRRSLVAAERRELEIVEGCSDVLFGQFISIYHELVGRKLFKPNRISQFRSLQERLPCKLKMRIFLCKDNGILCAGLICSAIGDTAIYLFGATSNAGLKSKGSYLLHWRLIEWLKENGIAIYDLHGTNAARNPGTYRFKMDLCGTNGRELQFVGQFDACPNVLSYYCVALADRLRQVVQTFRPAPGASGGLFVSGFFQRLKRRVLDVFSAGVARVRTRGGYPLHRRKLD
jgi:lipid II:glycine glycyltransferase (peptidoglycan interpeptide bridge formation enzyme)